jgi:spore coat polysaccharide biosynthesis protein SpsF
MYDNHLKHSMKASKPRVVGIIQARMSSSRLPGKVLMEIMGRPMLSYELERLAAIPEIDELIVATTINRGDDPIAALCEKMGVKTYRGSESDVLSRYYEAAEAARTDVVARFTADCPIIDPLFSSSVIKEFLGRYPRLDYLGMDYDAAPRGMDTEVFTFGALEAAHKAGSSKEDREHVTWYLHTNPGKFRTARFPAGEGLGAYRLTVDTKEDFALIRVIMERLYPSNPLFPLRDIIALLDSELGLRSINEGVRQKEYA